MLYVCFFKEPLYCFSIVAVPVGIFTTIFRCNFLFLYSFLYSLSVILIVATLGERLYVIVEFLFVKSEKLAERYWQTYREL